jgi:AAA domain
MSGLADQTAPPRCDPDQAIDFLRRWHSDEPRVVVTIDPTSGAIRRRNFALDADIEMRSFIDRAQGQLNCYTQVNICAPGTTKPGKAGMIAARALHIDADLKDMGGGADVVLARLRAFEPPPSIIIFSGGGYWPLWLLNEPYQADGWVERIEGVCAGLARTAGAAPGCHNIDRLMRLPGTLNVLNQAKRAAGRRPELAYLVEANWDRRYAAGVAPSLPDEMRPPPRGPSITSLPPKWRDVIKTGDASDYGGDRSDTVAAVARVMVDHGWSDEDIESVLLDREYGISAHAREQSDPRRAVRRVIALVRRWSDSGRAPSQATLPPLQLVSPQSFMGEPIPERRWIVPDWIPHGYVTGLYGPGGTGKSLLAMQLMTATALGKPWLGVAVEPVGSIGMFCEDDVDELRRRQAAINYQLYGRDLDELGDMIWLPRLGEDNFLMTFGRDGRGVPTPLFDQIREAALDTEAKLIVIDTVADTFGGNQNDAAQVRQYVVGCLGRLARDIGGAVLACAHPSRAEQNSGGGSSGSVQWDGAFRSRLYLSDPPRSKEDDRIDDPNARLLTRKKANYAARDETIELRWHDGVISHVTYGDEAERPDAEIVFLRLLDKMTAEGQTLSHNVHAGNFAPRQFATRPERRAYKQADFARALQALLSREEIRIEEYGRPSSPKERIVRAFQGIDPGCPPF